MTEKTVKVRTTFRPDLEMEMSATEAEDLRRQGLLVEPEEAPAQEGPEPEKKATRRAAGEGEKA